MLSKTVDNKISKRLRAIYASFESTENLKLNPVKRHDPNNHHENSFLTCFKLILVFIFLYSSPMFVHLEYNTIVFTFYPCKGKHICEALDPTRLFVGLQNN